MIIEFFEMIRRLILLYIAMFFNDQVWLQVSCFMALSLASLLYLTGAMPYKKPSLQFIQIFNRAGTLFVAYFIMVVNGVCTGNKQADSV